MKILFITSSSIHGGAQKHILEMFKSLTNSEHDVYLAAPKGWLTEELNHYPQKVKIINLTPFGRIGLRKILKGIQPDIVNTFILSGAVLGTIAWKKVRVGKLFVTVNNPVIYEGISLIGKVTYPLLYRWLSRYTNAFLVKSDCVRNEVESIILRKKPVLSIKNGIDFSVFDRKGRYSDLRSEWNISSGEIIICNVAALDERKGQLFLIEAVERLHRKYPVHLIIAGEGSYREVLEKKVAFLQADQFIHLLGKRTDINAVLFNSDIFVLPSIHEGLPNSLMEAMAMGLPCIASDVGGVRQLIKDDSFGYVIAPKNPHLLEQGLEELILNSELRKSMGKAAADLMYDQYRQDYVAKELIALYQKYL